MRIPRKYHSFLFSVLMALGMSFFMACAMLIIKAGFVPHFFRLLMEEWALGFAISLLPSLFLPPIIRKILGKFTREDK